MTEMPLQPPAGVVGRITGGRVSVPLSNMHQAGAAQAIWVTGGARVESPAQLSPAEQLLVLQSVFRFEPLARTASELEYTLKQMMTILIEMLELDLAAFVDYEQETVFGYAAAGGSELLRDELTTEASAIFAQRGDIHRTLRNTVLWNHRKLSGATPTTGDWVAIPSYNTELVKGCYLFHMPTGWHHSADALKAICATAEQCLVMPQLILANQKMNADMELRYKAVREMTELFRAIDDQDFSPQFLLILLEYVGVDRGILWEVDAQGRLLRTVQMGLTPDLAERFSVDGEQLFWQQLVRNGELVWLEEPLLLAGLPAPGEISVAALNTQVCHSFLGFPLKSENRVVGGIALLDADYTRAGGEQFIQVISDIAASYFYNSQSHRHLMQAKELEGQVKIAQEIQVGLMQSQLPDIPGFELLAMNLAAKECGGDFYHVLPAGDHVHLVVGDVSGKNVPAALLMAGSQFCLQMASWLKLPNERMMEALNSTLTAKTPSDRFVTMFFADLDPVQRQLECWNAGHDPLMLWRAATGEVELIDADGMILGVLDGVTYTPQTARMHPGDLALIYTDGLPEGMDAAREQFGFERIKAVLRQHGHGPAKDTLAALIAAHASFTAGQPQHDDITLVLLRALPDNL